MIDGVLGCVLALVAGLGPLEDALHRGDLEAAYVIAQQQLAEAPKGTESEGLAAYQTARIALASGEAFQSGKFFNHCADVYLALGQIPQATDCRYRAGQSFLSASKGGAAQSAWKRALNDLEKTGNGSSPAVVNIALALASLHAPDRFDRSNDMKSTRFKAIEYAQMAEQVLIELGQEQSEQMAEAFVLQGRMYDELSRDEEAIAAFDKAADIFSALGADYAHRVEDINLRKLSMSGKKGKDEPFSLTVDDGRTITFDIKKKRRVKTPKIKGKLAEAARAVVEVTLARDGTVAEVKILESHPYEDYGIAVADAVSTWTFVPTGGEEIESIPPFPYEVTFYIYHR